MYTEYGLDPQVVDDTTSIELIFEDIVNFNHIGNAAVLIFQSLTLEGWSDLMYIYSDANSPITSSIFFISVVIFGAFVSLNLVLAQIMHSFISTQEKEEASKKEKDLQQHLESEVALDAQAEDLLNLNKDVNE